MKLALLLVCGCLSAAPALAQRHVKNLSALSVLGGGTDVGNAAELTYGRFVTNRTVVRLGVLGERTSAGAGRATAAQLGVHVAPQLFQVGETLYVHALVGGIGRYEHREAYGFGFDGRNRQRQRVTGGPEVGLETDVYLLNRLALVGSLRQGYLFNDPLIDEWPTTALVGVRWFVR